jgi:hypothetical protein
LAPLHRIPDPTLQNPEILLYHTPAGRSAGWAAIVRLIICHFPHEIKRDTGLNIRYELAASKKYPPKRAAKFGETRKGRATGLFVWA